MTKTLLFLLILKVSYGFAQTIDCVPKDTLATGRLIVYHTSNNGYPDKISVHGQITKLIYGECGYFCFGGVIKVNLTKPIPQYSPSVVYIVTACLAKQTLCGEYITVEATKLTGDEKECYYGNILGGIDSKGVPFYKLTESETSKINWNGKK